MRKHTSILGHSNVANAVSDTAPKRIGRNMRKSAMENLGHVSSAMKSSKPEEDCSLTTSVTLMKNYTNAQFATKASRRWDPLWTMKKHILE